MSIARTDPTPWLVAAGLCLAAAALAATPEAEPALRAADLLPKQLLAGARYRVEDAAPVREYMPRFALKSDFGAFDVEGRELLETRIREIAALDKLEEVSKGEAFAKALAASAKKKAAAVANVVTDPGGSAKAAGKGAGRFMKGAFGKAKDAGEDAVDAATKDETEPTSGSQQSTGDKAESGAKDVLGVNKARRQWAKQAGVDPYTSNPPLSKKLDDLAWASYAGGFALTIAMPPIPGLSAVTTVNSLAWDLPPADLAKLNDQKLEKMGVSEKARKALAANKAFTPTQQAGFVAALDSLAGVADRELAVALAARLAQDEADARFFRRNAEILARAHAQDPLAKIEARQALFVGRTRSGKLILAAPVDYVSFTERVAEFAREKDPAGAPRELWISGTASPLAKQELAGARIALRERVLEDAAR